MKKGAALTLMFLFLMAAFVSAQEEGPVAISPGNDMGVAVVGQSTPTFSWTAVDWATAYRVEVFIAPENQSLPYKEMAAQSYPLLVKEIRGAATAWTPSAEEQLGNEAVYVWYVQAMNDFGAAAWSEGKAFTVNLAAAFAPIEEAVSDSLQEKGVSQEIIADVLSDVKTKMGERAVAAGTDNPIPISVQGTEISLRTLYGYSAGASNTGLYNTFIGTYTGQSKTTGYYNTFLGHRAGEIGATGANNTLIGSMAGYTTTSNNNVFVGYGSGRTNTSGVNTFIGYYSGYDNTTGNLNTFLGYYAGENNTTASYNSMVGAYAGKGNTTGHSNSLFGYYAGYINSTGYENVFQGREAGFSNTTGYRNTFIGSYAGRANTTADDNTFIGCRAGYSNTTASQNTFIGYYAGYSNVTGTYNTFMGYYAGYMNTASFNTFIGRWSGGSNTTGSNNSFLGYYSGANNTTGASNTFFGDHAGYGNTTASSNTFIGSDAGYNTLTGGNNTYVGYRAGRLNMLGTGNIFLGNQAGEDFTGNNKLFIDNTNTPNPLIWGNFNDNVLAVNGSIGINTHTPAFPMEMKKTGTNASIVVDRTDGATNYINATDTSGNFGTVTDHVLRLVVGSQWKLRLHTDNSLTMRNGASCSAGGTWTNASSRELKENITELSSDDAFAALQDLNPVQYNYKVDKEEDYIGFIAEDVPDLVATKDKKGMATMDVVAVLTKVLQEQQKVNEELRAEIEKLKELLRQEK